MKPHMYSLSALLIRLFALTLRLYPAGVRREYAAEMQTVFALEVTDAARRGNGRLIALAAREVRDLLPALLSAHFRTLRGAMNTLPSDTTDQTPWLTAVLSLLPFFIAGTLRIVISYQPGWSPQQGSPDYLWFELLNCLFVLAGFALGIFKKFPRWAYPYVFFTPFVLSITAMYAIYVYGWHIGTRNSFFLILVVILLILWLPGFRSFYRNIARDWTLLSYGMFGFVLYLLSTLDYSEMPRLTPMVLVPSLLTLCVALAHLRIRSTFVRIAVLVGGTTVSLFFWFLPLFRGMSSDLTGVGVVLFLFLRGAIILALILVYPMIVTRAVHRWRAPRSAS
jgi:hypothetical protein